MGKNKGFYDMGYDKGCWCREIGILLDFGGILEDIDKVKFWRKSVDESAYRNIEK